MRNLAKKEVFPSIRLSSKMFGISFVWSNILKKAFVSFAKDQCPWDLLHGRT